MTAPRLNLAPGDRVALAVAVVSTAALLLELTLPHRLDAPTLPEEAASEIVPVALDVVPVGPIEDYFSVSERPLFRHDRRPFVVAAEPVPAVPAGPRVEFELTAVIITSTTQIALLRSNMTPAMQRVTLNQTVDGWTLAEVTSNAVVLRRGAETLTVPLRPDLGTARSGRAARIEAGERGDERRINHRENKQL